MTTQPKAAIVAAQSKIAKSEDNQVSALAATRSFINKKRVADAVKAEANSATVQAAAKAGALKAIKARR
jgi:hypothetical protein